jgi:hypothetical protein
MRRIGETFSGRVRQIESEVQSALAATPERAWDAAVGQIAADLAGRGGGEK